mmetsp:Transcript_26539/g.63666  ORF Transcript_26539/g.63666 Transcript_26539/m.63666 type:complete len:295 (+) Transcript_26539:3398-4282(+)
MASRGKSGAKSSSSWVNGVSPLRNCAGPNSVSLKTLLIFRSASMLSTMRVHLFLCTKKLKYAGNSNSAKFTPSAGPMSLQNLSTGTIYTLGTAMPSFMESLIVSGGMPNWTCPTASVSTDTPPRGRSVMVRRGIHSYAASTSGPSSIPMQGTASSGILQRWVGGGGRGGCGGADVAAALCDCGGGEDAIRLGGVTAASADGGATSEACVLFAAAPFLLSSPAATDRSDAVDDRPDLPLPPPGGVADDDWRFPAGRDLRRARTLLIEVSFFAISPLCFSFLLSMDCFMMVRHSTH